MDTRAYTSGHEGLHDCRQTLCSRSDNDRRCRGSGQGIGAIKAVGPAGALVDRIAAEYLAALDVVKCW